MKHSAYALLGRQNFSFLSISLYKHKFEFCKEEKLRREINGSMSLENALKVFLEEEGVGERSERERRK
jgi:hypothetical protein